MALSLLTEVRPQDLLVALTELHNHMIGYVKSMALKCAVDLGIPNLVHRCGGAATLADIATHTALHSAKVHDLQRVMKLLCTSGIFTSTAGEDNNGAVMYRLTTTGRFLVGERNLSPMVPFLMSPLVVSSFFSMCDWLRCEPAVAGSPFELSHGCPQWEMASKDATLNRILNDSMVADSQLSLEVIILDKGYIFHGLSSLVDVGGGHGAAALIVANAFSHIKCTVLDLPHVIGQCTTGDYAKLRFVSGDMFKSIPPADAVLVKNILHDWGDDDCVKILQHCKDAIPARNAGGKVIIIEMMRGSSQENGKIKEMEDSQNMFMMCINGMERDENEWKKIFSAAGFSDDYQIMPILGPLSVIELYP